MGAKTAKIPVECPACGKTFGTAIRGANAKCTGTKDKPCGRTIYIRRDGSYGEHPAPDQPKDPPPTTDPDDPPAPPAPTTQEVPRYGYDDKSKPAAAGGGGRPRKSAPRRRADVQPANRDRGAPELDGVDRGGDDGRGPDSEPPARRRFVDRFRRRRADGGIPYPYGDIFG